AGLGVRAGLEGHPSENGAAMLTLTTAEQAPPEWQDVRIVARGAELRATVGDAAGEAFSAGRTRGNNRVLHHHNNDAVVEVRDVRLRPLALRSLFNGTDLTGWNIIPDRKSEFSVVDGALNIRNGNGQIETADVFKDFILQLDVIANGTQEKPL